MITNLLGYCIFTTFVIVFLFSFVFFFPYFEVKLTYSRLQM